jgi:hypothetical protein
MRRSRWLLAVFLAVLVLGPGAPIGGSAEADQSNEAIFRREFGLRSDPDFIRWVADSFPISRTWGVALTPDEEADLDARASVAGDLGRLTALLEETPGYAGLYLDQERGGMVVISFVAGADIPIGSVKAALAGARYEILSVTYSMAELKETQDAIGDLMVSGDGPAAIVFVNADPITNRVVVGLDPFDPGVAQWLTDRFGPTVVAIPTLRPVLL